MTDPFALFAPGSPHAEASEPNDANAFALATATADARPSVRIVLLKGWDENGFVFYSNLDSRKGRELAANPPSPHGLPLEKPAPPGPHRWQCRAGR